MLFPVTDADDVLLDIRYATADNLTGKPIYHRPVALLRHEARDALLAAAARAKILGLRLKLFDAFRPLDAQWALWKALPDPRFVADPNDGRGMHPRGVAVDLTLVDRHTGLALDMGTGFDAMTPQSAQAALDLAPEAIRNRTLLLGVMTASGWRHIASEWWHYELPGQDALPLLWAADVPDGPMSAA
ncbi:MAG: D-alanyl-D-alanine dipeptidase [Acetobacteraceae bacterium]